MVGRQKMQTFGVRFNPPPMIASAPKNAPKSGFERFLVAEIRASETKEVVRRGFLLVPVTATRLAGICSQGQTFVRQRLHATDVMQLSSVASLLPATQPDHPDAEVPEVVVPPA